jgi:hypothetical protein
VAALVKSTPSAAAVRPRLLHFDCAWACVEPSAHEQGRARARASWRLERLADRVPERRGHLLSSLRRRAALTGDPELDRLHAELASYPGVELEPPETAAGDITLDELSIEAFYPADAATGKTPARTRPDRMKSLNLGLAFLLELALLAAVAYWAAGLNGSTVVRWSVLVGAPLALALVWSLIAAPNARRRLSAAPLILFKLTVFTLGTVLLYSRGQPWFAVALEALAVGNLAWRSRGIKSDPPQVVVLAGRGRRRVILAPCRRTAPGAVGEDLLVVARIGLGATNRLGADDR